MKKTAFIKILSLLLTALLLCMPLSAFGTGQDPAYDEESETEYEISEETEIITDDAVSEESVIPEDEISIGATQDSDIPEEIPEETPADEEFPEEIPEEELSEENVTEDVQSKEFVRAEEDILTGEEVSAEEDLPAAGTSEALQEETDDPELFVSGSITWKIQDNTLYISGSGKMPDYGFETAPWYGKKSLIRKAVIEKGVTSIGDMAFWDCTELTEVTLPAGIRSIGKYAFMESGIRKITLNSGLTTIGEGAFNSCRSLSSVTIPASVTGIADYVFESCTALESISVKSGNTAYSSKNGALFNSSGTVLVVYPAGKTDTSYSIPSSVESILPGAFSGNSYIKSVVIPESVTAVPVKAFGSCTALTEITLPNSLSSIGSYAFYNCGRLKSLIIPKSVTSIGENAFIFCNSLEYIYYTGTKTAWNKISIDSTNEDIFNSVIIYDYTGKVSIKKASVLLSAASMVYTGKALTPVPTVTLNGKELAKGVDYSVSYTDNINAGTATVVIKGKGRYTGTVKKTFTILLATPKLVSAVNARTGVQITWDQVAGAGKYRVFRRTADSGWTRLGDTDATSFTDVTAVSNTLYKYTVRCLSSDGSGYVSLYDKYGINIKYHAAPVITSVYNTASGIVVKWAAEKGISKFQVYRRGAGESWQRIAVTTTNQYFDNTATAGKTYAYTVRCLSNNGLSALSSYQAGTAIRRLTVPVLQSAVYSSGMITVRWKKTAGAAGYYVYRKTANGGWQRIATIRNSDTLRYIDKNIKSGTAYTYTIRAFNGIYVSSYRSEGISATAK